MHAIRTIRAAESYRGTSLLIAFSHCINWGINMVQGMEIQKNAVACGYWPLYSFDPRDQAHPFKLASKKPEGAFKDFALKEARFGILARSKPDESARLLELGQQDIDSRYHFYEQLAGVDRTVAAETAAAAGNGRRRRLGGDSKSPNPAPLGAQLYTAAPFSVRRELPIMHGQSVGEDAIL